MTNMKQRELTNLQRKIFEYIEAHPLSTYNEIRIHCQLRWNGSVASVVRALAKKQYIEYKKQSPMWTILKK